MKFLKHLYFQVLLAVVLGVGVGHFFPVLGRQLKPLGDGFVALIKMLIAPLIFTTVVGGIASMGDLRKIGRLGWKALLYFEVVTTLALAIGLVVAHVVLPGAGVNASVEALDAAAVSGYATAAKSNGVLDLLAHTIPRTFVGAFAEGDVLQVLLLAVLFGCALARCGKPGRVVIDFAHAISDATFAVVGMITRLAPVGAFGAMGFTIGKYGAATLGSLGKLMLCVYATSALFVVLVLGAIARLHGFSLWKTLRYIREEILIVIGTSSSESALPGLMEKLRRAGCASEAVGIIVPAGYSFNLAGTSIYLTMAALFIAQAMNVPLSLGEELGLLGVLLLTSKGAAAVTGGGFITLAATLSATGKLPVAGLALILGIDRFMSECRAVTNLVGNTVATLVVARWENEIDLGRAGDVLAGPAGRAIQPAPASGETPEPCVAESELPS